MADKTITQDSYDQVSYPDEIRSGGLGPCIAVGVFHKSKKIGYMFHGAAPHQATLFNEFLEHVVHETKNSKANIVWMCGASIEDQDEQEDLDDANEARDYVESTVRSTLKTNKIEVQWSDDNVTSELILKLETFLSILCI